IFLHLTPANATQHQDKDLPSGKLFHYMVRAVNGTGAASPSNAVAVRVLQDKDPPTAPAGLRYTAGPGQYAVRLSWEASTDNLGVARYDIYINERKVFSNPSPSFTVTGLDSLIPYRFTVRAAD